MKNTTTLLLFFCFTIAIFGQENDGISGFEKGNFLITGEFNSERFEFENSTDRSTLIFTPIVSYFLTDHWTINTGLLLGKSSTDNNAGDEIRAQSNRGWVLGSTYYFSPAERFSLSAGIQGSWEKTIFEDPPSNLEYDVNTTVYFLAPGFNYFLSDRFAINGRIGLISYFKSETSYEPRFVDYRFDTFQMGIDFSNIRFGATYKF